MLMIWSSLARNRSPSLVASCFFGRIVFSDAAIESRFASQGNPKTKSQGSAASDRQTLQSKTCCCPENRFIFNRLEVVHRRLGKARFHAPRAVPIETGKAPDRELSLVE